MLASIPTAIEGSSWRSLLLSLHIPRFKPGSKTPVASCAGGGHDHGHPSQILLCKPPNPGRPQSPVTAQQTTFTCTSNPPRKAHVSRAWSLMAQKGGVRVSELRHTHVDSRPWVNRRPLPCPLIRASGHHHQPALALSHTSQHHNICAYNRGGEHSVMSGPMDSS